MSGIVTMSQLGRYGRFANGVFQIMSTIGIARRNGYNFRFPLWINHDHKERFGSTEDVDIYRHLVNELPLWTGEPYPQRWVNWGYEEVNLSHNTDLLGHMQSERYFAHAIDEVRHYLTFKDEPEHNDYCAIHWRAGDYQDGGKSAYHPRQGMNYYDKAINQFPKETRFLVFSDDTMKAHEMFFAYSLATHRDISISTQKDYIADFKFMKQCNSFICANSSFSLAAAILANQPGKKIVCPSLWFGEPAGGLKMDYPENCVVI